MPLWGCLFLGLRVGRFLRCRIVRFFPFAGIGDIPSNDERRKRDDYHDDSGSDSPEPIGAFETLHKAEERQNHCNRRDQIEDYADDLS